jgi:ubiquinone/menaquinone biosynthesis C-methylase UbiE
MRLDRFVHSKPTMYAKKLEAINFGKRVVYKALFIDKHIQQQRADIARRNAEVIRRHLKGKKILEIGCGQGSFLATLLRDYGCDCYGVDISPEMVAYAEKQNPGPRYAIMISSQLEFDDTAFDFVIFNYVLHHVDDLDGTIREAKRVGKHILIYESCAFATEPLRYLSNLYWRTVDGGNGYKSLAEWKRTFDMEVVEEIEGMGLVRYGMCIFKHKAVGPNTASIVDL